MGDRLHILTLFMIFVSIAVLVVKSRDGISFDLLRLDSRIDQADSFVHTHVPLLQMKTMNTCFAHICFHSMTSWNKIGCTIVTAIIIKHKLTLWPHIETIYLWLMVILCRRSQVCTSAVAL